MSDKAAFAGTYADFKTVKTRSTFQVIVEMPIEQAERFVSVFGMPIPGKEQPVALALLRPEKPQEKPRKSWGDISRSQQSGILSSDPGFQQYVGVTSQIEAADYIREHCRVTSRAHLDDDELAGTRWDALVYRYRADTGQQTEQRG